MCKCWVEVEEPALPKGLDWVSVVQEDVGWPCAGMCAQVHSGSLLRATMHCVRGAAGPAAAGVTRHSFALFMQPR